VGFATAASFGPLIADVSQWFLRRRGIAVAIIASGNYLSGAFWPLVLADVLAGPGWRTAYLIIAASALLVMLPLTYALRKPLPEEALADLRRRRRAQVPRDGAVEHHAPVAPGARGDRLLRGDVHAAGPYRGLLRRPRLRPRRGGRDAVAHADGRRRLAPHLGLLADRLGGVLTLLIGSTLQMIALFLYLPTSGLAPLYIVSLIFGLSQGGIVPSYAIIVREYLPPREAGAKVGFVIMATIVGMALGGWMSGWIYDLTGSYRMAFLNGIAFNALNVAVMLLILFRSRPRTGRARLSRPDPLHLSKNTQNPTLTNAAAACRRAARSHPRPPPAPPRGHQHLHPRRQPRDLRVLPRDDVGQFLHRAHQMRQRFLQFGLLAHVTASLPICPPSDRRAAHRNSRHKASAPMAKQKKQPRPKAETPKGFRDYFGAEVTERNRMLAQIAEVYDRYGFDPLETRAVETVEALGKFLPDVDRPNDGVFAFEDDGTWLALRYDMTAPLARVAAQFRNDLPSPYRRYTMGPVWRNEKPGPGRFRQFYQCDADTVGSASSRRTPRSARCWPTRWRPWASRAGTTSCG
jgi:MFS family permease